MLHASDPADADSPTRTACLTNGGCFLCSGTLTCTNTSPALIVCRRRFFSDAFCQLLLHFSHFFPGGVINSMVLTPPAFLSPARLPIFPRLILRQACQCWRTLFAVYFVCDRMISSLHVCNLLRQHLISSVHRTVGILNLIHKSIDRAFS